MGNNFHGGVDSSNRFGRSSVYSGSKRCQRGGLDWDLKELSIPWTVICINIIWIGKFRFSDVDTAFITELHVYSTPTSNAVIIM